MHMPNNVVVPQVHRLARRAKANKTLTFTNLAGDDLDALYTGLERDDDLALDAELTVVDKESNNEDEDPNYYPNDDTSKDDDNESNSDNADEEDGQDTTNVNGNEAEDANENEAEDANNEN